MIGALTHLAEPSTETSYGGLIISGVVTIIVALIGAWATRTLRNRTPPAASPPTQPVILPGDEPEWAKNLRENTLKENAKLQKRIRWLERVMSIYDIDSDTGRRLPDAATAFPDPPPPPTDDEDDTFA